MRTIEFKIKIEPHFTMTNKQAYEKLLAWFELNGHTSTGHGFDFKELANLGKDDQ